MGIDNIAHIRSSTKEVQSLEEHLSNCAELAEMNSSKIGLHDIGRLVGLLHDLGKATSRFNAYICDISEDKRGDIDHSTAGAQYLFRKEGAPSGNGSGPWDRIADQMAELVIMSHHSGLIDCLSSAGENRFEKRILKSDIETGFSESIIRIGKGITEEADSIRSSAIGSLAGLIEKIVSESDKKDRMFRLGLLSRFLLSCLIDADHTDTGNYESGISNASKQTDWGILVSRYHEYMRGLDRSSEISRIRAEVLKECTDASHRDKGIFTLSVPTGGGKTLSSLGFSLEHLKFHGMERIIYVVPYTSIIDQNAGIVRSVLDRGEDVVREYHSNIDIGDADDDQDNPWRCYSDPWDSPIIFTTMVQFLDTFFSSGTKCARRMHNMANSVIVFDEIQTIPIKTVYMFNEAVNFLVNQCGSTAVLCTATQPLLGEGLLHPLNLNGDSEIIRDVKGLFSSMERARVEYLDGNALWKAEEISELALDKIKDVDSLLIIANTKKMVRSIYDEISKSIPEDVRLYHLSTNMCPVHRTEVLGSIFESLKKEKVICVSTQLIEAGIDIDFNAVIRSLAGVDSIAQAAGRCNRNGSMEGLGTVYVVKTDEYLGRLEDIAIGRKCAESVFHEFKDDPLGVGSIERYFEQYFYERKGNMSYNTDNPERPMFDMLSANLAAARSYEGINGKKTDIFLRQSFKEANDGFHVIESQRGVIVPFNEESREIICGLCSDDYNTRMNLLRRAQRHSVNTYSFDSLLKRGLIREVSEGSGIYYLLDGNYDLKYGLAEGSRLDTKIM